MQLSRQNIQTCATKSFSPFYIDNDAAAFTHRDSHLQLTFCSNWDAVEASMNNVSNVCAIYYPPELDLQHSAEVEKHLVKDIRAWRFFENLGPRLGQLAVDMARFVSAKMDVSYERRMLLHRHLAWVFVADEVTERFPLHDLHTTAGKIYVENLKKVPRGEPVQDLHQFEDRCSKELIERAMLAQNILAEELMPMKKKMLSRQHLEKVVEGLDAYFDHQYIEAFQFTKQPSSKEILKTRVHCIGIMVPNLICMTDAQAAMFKLDDPCIIQTTVLVSLFHDIVGLYKDIESSKRGDDGSADMNIARVLMKEQGIEEHEVLRFLVKQLNSTCHNFEFFLNSYTPERRQFYIHVLTICFNFYDFHLVGAFGKPNVRYGWKLA